jgi:hypothetical protein
MDGRLLQNVHKYTFHLGCNNRVQLSNPYLHLFKMINQVLITQNMQDA